MLLWALISQIRWQIYAQILITAASLITKFFLNCSTQTETLRHGKGRNAAGLRKAQYLVCTVQLDITKDDNNNNNNNNAGANVPGYQYLLIVHCGHLVISFYVSVPPGNKIKDGNSWESGRKLIHDQSVTCDWVTRYMSKSWENHP